MPKVQTIYETMLTALGPSRWWPGDTPFEVAVGAMLTQNTAWTNVEKALVNLKAAGPLTPAALLAMPEDQLAEHIRPSGYFRRKAGRLRNFLAFLADQAHNDDSSLDDPSLPMLRGRALYDLRPELLSVSGIGPETADSILLYALDLPAFVVDAYTHRMAVRHGLVDESAGYDELAETFASGLPQDVQIYNECHALIVRTAKHWCKKSNPQCDTCPLAPLLPA